MQLCKLYSCCIQGSFKKNRSLSEALDALCSPWVFSLYTAEIKKIKIKSGTPFVFIAQLPFQLKYIVGPGCPSVNIDQTVFSKVRVSRHFDESCVLWENPWYFTESPLNHHAKVNIFLHI